jgi:hypothetical protein
MSKISNNSQQAPGQIHLPYYNQQFHPYYECQGNPYFGVYPPYPMPFPTFQAPPMNFNPYFYYNQPPAELYRNPYLQKNKEKES